MLFRSAAVAPGPPGPRPGRGSRADAGRGPALSAGPAARAPRRQPPPSGPGGAGTDPSPLQRDRTGSAARLSRLRRQTLDGRNCVFVDAHPGPHRMSAVRPDGCLRREEPSLWQGDGCPRASSAAPRRPEGGRPRPSRGVFAAGTSALPRSWRTTPGAHRLTPAPYPGISPRRQASATSRSPASPTQAVHRVGSSHCTTSDRAPVPGGSMTISRAARSSRRIGIG